VTGREIGDGCAMQRVRRTDQRGRRARAVREISQAHRAEFERNRIRRRPWECGFALGGRLGWRQQAFKQSDVRLCNLRGRHQRPRKKSLECRCRPLGSRSLLVCLKHWTTIAEPLWRQKHKCRQTASLLQYPGYRGCIAKPEISARRARAAIIHRPTTPRRRSRAQSARRRCFRCDIRRPKPW
jgi:hypothetical protein